VLLPGSLKLKDLKISGIEGLVFEAPVLPRDAEDEEGNGTVCLVGEGAVDASDGELGAFGSGGG